MPSAMSERIRPLTHQRTDADGPLRESRPQATFSFPGWRADSVNMLGGNGPRLSWMPATEDSAAGGECALTCNRPGGIDGRPGTKTGEDLTGHGDTRAGDDSIRLSIQDTSGSKREMVILTHFLVVFMSPSGVVDLSLSLLQELFHRLGCVCLLSRETGVSRSRGR